MSFQTSKRTGRFSRTSRRNRVVAPESMNPAQVKSALRYLETLSSMTPDKELQRRISELKETYRASAGA